MMRPSADLPRLYLCREPVDCRKGMQSLAVLVEQSPGLDPFAETLCLFTNRRRDAVKCLYWERNGFCLWHKRLEQHHFKWPRHPDGAVVTLTGQGLNWLLDGYDLRHLTLHSVLNYKTVLWLRQSVKPYGWVALCEAFPMPTSALAAAELRDDVEALKQLVVAQAEEYETELARLREQLNLLLAKRYGPSSEKLSPDPFGLFNEAKSLPEEPPAETVPVAAHARKRRGRKPLPDDLPRVRIEHDLPEEEKTCVCGCGLTRIGEDTSEQLDIVPAQVRVLQHVRLKYVCKAGEETIKTAPVPGAADPQEQRLTHARRKFDEALKAQSTKARSGKAQMGLAFIQRLYAVEKPLTEADPEERWRARQHLARPISPTPEPASRCGSACNHHRQLTHGPTAIISSVTSPPYSDRQTWGWFAEHLHCNHQIRPEPPASFKQIGQTPRQGQRIPAGKGREALPAAL